MLREGLEKGATIPGQGGRFPCAAARFRNRTGTLGGGAKSSPEHGTRRQYPLNLDNHAAPSLRETRCEAVEQLLDLHGTGNDATKKAASSTEGSSELPDIIG